MNKKFNIWKTFEIFNSYPISILKERIRFMFIDTNSNDASISANISSKNGIEINIFNSEGAYNLLTSVFYRSKQKAENELK